MCPFLGKIVEPACIKGKIIQIHNDSISLCGLVRKSLAEPGSLEIASKPFLIHFRFLPATIIVTRAEKAKLKLHVSAINLVFSNLPKCFDLIFIYLVGLTISIGNLRFLKHALRRSLSVSISDQLRTIQSHETSQKASLRGLPRSCLRSQGL